MVDEFNVKEDLSTDGVIRGPDLLEMQKRVNGSKECAVEPTSPLGDELRYGIYETSTRGYTQLELMAYLARPFHLLPP